MPAAQAFADAARLSSSDVSWKRDAPPAADAEEHAGKTAVNEANQSQNLCIWLCPFFGGKSTGAGGLTVQFICFYDFYATFRGSSDPAALCYGKLKLQLALGRKL